MDFHLLLKFLVIQMRIFNVEKEVIDIQRASQMMDTVYECVEVFYLFISY